VLAVAASMLLFAWWTGVASAAPANIEICKYGDMTAGVTFHFTLTKGGTTIPGGGDYLVQGGGGCGPSLPTTSGNVVIQENIVGDWMMTDAVVHPGTNATLVKANPATGKITVTVGAVATGGEAIVDVTNAPLAGTVKICKTSSEPAFQGKLYSFTVNGLQASATSNTGNTPGQCSQAFTIQPGSKINVTESVPPNQQVQTSRAPTRRSSARR